MSYSQAQARAARLRALRRRLKSATLQVTQLEQSISLHKEETDRLKVEKTEKEANKVKEIEGLFFAEEGWAAAEIYSAASASDESGSADGQTFEEILEDSYKLTDDIRELRADCSKRIGKLPWTAAEKKTISTVLPTHQVGVVAPPAAPAIVPGENLSGEPTTDAITPADTTPKAKRSAGSTRGAPPAKKGRGTIRNFFTPA